MSDSTSAALPLNVKPPPRTTDLRGKTFGLVTVLECVGKLGNSRHSWWSVQCSCPKKKIFNVAGYSLTRGNTKSCGCLLVAVGKANATHGMSRTPEYNAWINARKRTRDPNHPQYKDYGGRGVTISDELHDSFPLWNAELGPRPSPDYSVDRKENNKGNYVRGNLKWSTKKEQQRNRRCNVFISHNGENLTAGAWGERIGVSDAVIWARIRKYRWSVEKAVTTPLKKTKPEPKPVIFFEFL